MIKHKIFTSIFVLVILIIVFSVATIFYKVTNYEPGNIVNDEGKISELSKDEKEKIISEFPVYSSRKVEQTYLTLPEWYQVYSYNEFGDFLHNGGKQTDFPFIKSIKNFWEYHILALGESKEEKFNWQYNFVSWVIGANYTVEYLIKSAYENTVGRITQLVAGSDTEADKFIANSWNNYAEKMYQATWYHYPYFDDLKGIWTQTSLFDKSFVRSFERKIAFSFSYLIKGTYAKVWLLTAVQKENQTFGIVYVKDKSLLENEGVKILKELSGDKYLIETERYAGFKNMLLRLTTKGVQFVEIMGHDVIALAYLSKQDSEPFLDSKSVGILDKRKLFFNEENYLYRVTVKAGVRNLSEAIGTINESGSKFEMIYDF